jgi:8-amino-7-oxononanoate synthase
MALVDQLQRDLAELREAGLLRLPRSVSSAQGPELIVAGRPAINLCSNNYLGLANHPAFAAAIDATFSEFGFGAAGSRQITGTMTPHLALERRLARFLDQPAALLFATGYSANLGSLQALARPTSLVLSDALNHASTIDGCRLSRATVRVYRHCDPGHVEHLLQTERAKHASAFVVTESLFSMDGDVAPLTELRTLCDRYDVALIVDEAHALGVYGPGGRGLCAAEGVIPDLLLGALGKAFGAMGGFAAGPEPTLHWLANRARSYVFSTAPSPIVPAAAIAATDLVEAADERRATLRVRAQQLRTGLQDIGYNVPSGTSPIIPVLLGEPQHATELSHRLLELGVFVHGIRPPTVPEGTSRLRVTAIASHEHRHIDKVLNAFRELRR